MPTGNNGHGWTPRVSLEADFFFTPGRSLPSWRKVKWRQNQMKAWNQRQTVQKQKKTLVLLANTGIRTGETFTSEPSNSKMAKQHPIERIASRLKEYKYCKGCRKINWHENNFCIGCGQRNFRPMDDEYARTLLLDWEKEPDLMVEV
jgi:hypothetical protein